MRVLLQLFSLTMMWTATCCSDSIYVADEALQLGSDDSEKETGFIAGTDDVGDTATIAIPPTDPTCDLPETFSWVSSAPLFLQAGDTLSIKDPTVVFFDKKWLVYTTTVGDPLSLTYLEVTDWDPTASVSQIPVSTNDNLSGYKAAPQLFYFAPKNIWYLIYQQQEPAYSTSHDPTDVLSWSLPTPFMPMPTLLTDNDAEGIDYWVICDNTDCYLFFSANNGILYRAKTDKNTFPNGFDGTTEIVMEDDTFNLFNASNVYKIEGRDEYLLLVLALGDTGRYFRSWTSDRLDGSWKPLAATESNAFASTNNVTGDDWVNTGIEHGEMLRHTADETMTIDPCDMRYLYSALKTSELDPEIEYFRLGLLTPTQ